MCTLDSKGLLTGGGLGANTRGKHSEAREIRRVSETAAWKARLQAGLPGRIACPTYELDVSE